MLFRFSMSDVLRVAALSLLSELLFAILQRVLVSPGLRSMIDDAPPTAVTPWLTAPQPPPQTG